MSSGNALVTPTGSTFSSLPNNGPGLDARQWNALIGIVTAIVGNILISCALNLQRYAHIRIRRERATWELKGKVGHPSDYGTQAKIAEERSRINLKTPAARGGGLPLHGEYDETTPLRDTRRASNISEAARSQDSRESENARQEHSKNYLKSPWWWAGIILMTIGEAGNFLAYNNAPRQLYASVAYFELVMDSLLLLSFHPLASWL